MAALMKKLVLILLALALIVLPVSATLINVTIAENAADIFTGSLDVSIVTASNTNAYQSAFASGFLFDRATYIHVWGTSNLHINFLFKRVNAADITATITKQPTGLFSGTETCSITGGSSRTWTYEVVPGVGGEFFDFASPLKFVYGITKGSGSPSVPAYLLCIPATTQFIGNAMYTDYQLNTTEDAYIQFPAKITTNPIYSVSAMSSDGVFTLEVISKKMSLLADNEHAIASNVTSAQNDWWTGLSDLIGFVSTTAKLITEFFKKVAGFIGTLGALAAFIFAGEIFFTLVAAYTIMALVLSFYDSDDLFWSIGKFYRYEMRLWRFFMEIFKWIKEIIKWW